MPELPEVEIVRRQLDKVVVGHKILDVWHDWPKILRPSPERFVAGVEGKTVTGTRRRAKLLVIDLSGNNATKPDSFISVQLRMTGRLLWRRHSDPEDDYVHAKLVLDKGRELRFSEARKFGYLQYIKSPGELKRTLSGYGPEPLDDLTAADLFARLQKTKRPVKTALLDQSLLSGVGNIYAVEALWLAKIDPRLPSSKLSREAVDRLLKALEDVLEKGLQYGGASDNWYRHLDGGMGSYQKHFLIYGKRGTPCSRCGKKVSYTRLGGRGTHFCPGCQV